MKNIVIKMIFLTMFIGLLSACNPNEKNVNTTSESQQKEVPTEILTKSKTEKKAPTLAEQLPILEQESEERYYKSGALVINLLPMEIGIGEHEPLLEKLFPNATISPADATELIDAFNIEQNGKTYSVAITYGEASDASFVIDKFYVFEQKFSIELLNNLI